MKTPQELGKALIHPGPIITLFLIKSITVTATYCCIMWWPPVTSIWASLWMFSFFSLSGLTLYNFLAAMSLGPGHVPKGWKPDCEDDLDKVQYCTICKGHKAPRAHHCRKCGKCVLKMDHHCPWINECVGHRNHAHFFGFLISAVYGCSQASFIIACSLYHALFRSYYKHYRVKDVPIVTLNIYSFIWCLFSLGCAVGVTLGVGCLLLYQLKGILSNQTSIEEWIEEKAQYRRKADPHLPPYEHPYSFGWKANWRLILNLKCEAIGDGIVWPVVPNTNQYTLTVEQIEQKKDKQRRIQKVIVIEAYNGKWFPFFSKGFCIAAHPPCSDESRIQLSIGDTLLVSRWKKYWLYGEKVTKDGSVSNEGEEIKGWFPRRCVSVKRTHRPTCQNYSDGEHEVIKGQGLTAAGDHLSQDPAEEPESFQSGNISQQTSQEPKKDK